MSEIAQPNPFGRLRPRFTLFTLLLLTAAVAVWLAAFRMSGQIDQLRAELGPLKEAARELVVVDPTQCALIKRLPERFAENIWDVYLPEGHDFQLCLALEQLEWENYPEPQSRRPISAGVHSLEVQLEKEADGWQVKILVDGEVVIQEQRPAEWIPTGGSQSKGITNLDPLSRLGIYRQRFNANARTGPTWQREMSTNGILLWIEPRRNDAAQEAETPAQPGPSTENLPP